MLDNNIKGISEGKRLFIQIEKDNLILSIISIELNVVKKTKKMKTAIVNIFFINITYSLS